MRIRNFIDRTQLIDFYAKEMLGRGTLPRAEHDENFAYECAAVILHLKESFLESDHVKAGEAFVSLARYFQSSEEIITNRICNALEAKFEVQCLIDYLQKTRLRGVVPVCLSIEVDLAETAPEYFAQVLGEIL